MYQTQSDKAPIAEAFFDVVRKDARFDSFSPVSGERIGVFRPEGVIPWRPEEEIPSQGGKKHPTRSVPKGFLNSKDEHTLVYDEEQRFATEDKATMTFTILELMWCCPGPDMGPAVVTANVRLRGQTMWQQMSYSLRESAIRFVYTHTTPSCLEFLSLKLFISSHLIYSFNFENRISEKKSGNEGSNAAVSSDGKVSVTFDFDQVERHRIFWDFLRNKEWNSVSAFIEKKVNFCACVLKSICIQSCHVLLLCIALILMHFYSCVDVHYFTSQAVAYNRGEMVRRKFRVMNLLAEMFDSTDWLILHSPFIFTAGVTKSVALCDVSDRVVY